MKDLSLMPDAPLLPGGKLSEEFLKRGVATYAEACRYVLAMPYGYNSDRDDPLILFKEGKGTCTTKHAVAASLALELGLPVVKYLGVYPMDEALVTGAGAILEKYGLPYLPMLHCFLARGDLWFDLTEGNRNGKNGPVDRFLHVQKVSPDVSAKEEYLIYRKALTGEILIRPEFAGVTIKTVLQAREEGLALLKKLVA